MHIRRGKPTKVFLRYVVLLFVRLAMLAWGVALYILRPERLSLSGNFGIRHGLSFPNVLFLLMLGDMATKFVPRAHIAVGSLKQYRSFHVPTAANFKGGRDELMRRVRELIPTEGEPLERIRQLLRNTTQRGRELYDRGREAIDETYTGLRDDVQLLLRDIDVLRLLPFNDEDLTADRRMRSQIRRDRFRQTVPVLLFWIVFNVAIGLTLNHFGWLNERTILLWATFYFVFDMICVVLWCPLQLLLMRNRCCTTCQIFNWDAIMYVTPLFLLVPTWSPFVLVLLAGALVVLVRWELAFFRHPERFDERTNASLACANCKDRLCYLRGSLREIETELSSGKVMPGSGAAAHTAGH